jgi:hypothetical protein
MEMIDYRLDLNGHWSVLVSDPVKIDGEVIDERDWRPCLVTDVPVDKLLQEWECMLLELSRKEVEYFKLKEYYESESHHLETTVDFKELYGKNNADVRKHHIKVELSDVYDKMKDLEFGINWIRSYIPLLKEVIRSKR